MNYPLKAQPKTKLIKLTSCRVGLLKLHRSGTIQLPPPLRTNGNGKGLIRQKVKLSNTDPINIPIKKLKSLRLKKVKDKKTEVKPDDKVDDK